MVWSINNHFTDSNRIFIMVIVKKRNDENWVLILILCMKSEKYTDTFFVRVNCCAGKQKSWFFVCKMFYINNTTQK